MTTCTVLNNDISLHKKSLWVVIVLIKLDPGVKDCIFFAGMFFALTMVMVTIALVMAVISTNIYSKKDGPQRCHPFIVKLATKFYPSLLKEREAAAVGRRNMKDCRIVNGRHSDILSIADTEMESLTCSCCKRCNRRDSDVSFRAQEEFDHDSSEAEWRVVAKFVDRLFFWVFVILSISTQTALFLQMAPGTRPEE